MVRFEYMLSAALNAIRPTPQDSNNLPPSTLQSNVMYFCL